MKRKGFLFICTFQSNVIILQDEIEIEGMIRDPGRFVFVVHFYMPGEVGMDIPVNIHTDGQDYKGIQQG